MSKIGSIFEKIRYYFKWESIYMTTEIDQYSKIKGALNDHGVLSKTRIINPGFASRGHSGGYVKSTYEILIKPDKADLAGQIIHDLR